MPDAKIHPTPQDLAAFGLGKLPERAAAAIAAHLASCPACRESASAVPPDTFLDKIRAAGRDSTSFPPSLAKPPNTASGPALPAMPVVPCPNIPPELANHPKYLIRRRLNQGGMGVVYQGWHKEMNRQIVIKVINRALLDRPEALERFRREIQAAAQLSHPNIVTAHDAEQVGELHMLVMEFVAGQDLAEVVEKKGSLSVRHACYYMRQVAWGLQHAYERGMVHRDIKPHNLIRTPKGQIKILDFGLAKIASEHDTTKGLTASGDFMGTPEYTSPEQAEDASKADIRADLYSLGCTLYCLLAGRPPFSEETRIKTILAHRDKAPQPLMELRPDVPERLWRVVARLLAKHPGQRYQKPIEVVQALAPFVKPGSNPEVKGAPAPAERISSPARGTLLSADTNEIKRILQELPGRTPPKDASAKEAAASPFADLTNKGADSKNILQLSEAAEPSTRVWWKPPRVLASAVSVFLSLTLMAAIIIKLKTPEAPPDNRPPAASEPSADDNGFVSLFDSKGKTGWITHPTQKGNWRVNDRILTGSGDNVSHLYTIRDDYTDFHLVLEVRINAGGKSGVYFRAPNGPNLPADNPRWLAAYNARIDADGLGGLMIDLDPELRRSQGSVLQPDEWLIYEVIVQGNHIVITVNGQTTCDYIDDQRRYTKGRIVLQQYGPQTKVEFRKIKLKELATEPAEQQIAAVENQLKKLNPGFNGWIKQPTIENGVVTGLEFVTDHVTDISPLRALKGLKRLSCIGSGDHNEKKGKLADLSPLSGLPLTTLNVDGNSGVSDLSPLKGMPLEDLSCNKTRVTDLLPLKELPLKTLDCDFQPERDAEILRSIKTLKMINDKPVADFLKPNEALGKHDDAEALIKRGNDLLQDNKDVDGAIAAFRRAVQLKKNSPEAHCGLGRALLGKDSEDAIFHLRLAIQFRDADHQAHCALGHALLDQKNYEEAFTALDRAIKLDNNCPGAHQNLGFLLETRGDLKRAIAEYCRAIRLNPKLISDHSRQRPTLRQLVELLPRVLRGEAPPAEPSHRLLLAEICRADKRPEWAARLAAGAFKDNPSLANDLTAEYRYYAARAAALAGCGKEKDAGKLDERERVHWRKQALAWLRADLDLLQKELKGADDKTRSEVHNKLWDWQNHRDLAVVRDDKELAGLPEAERQDWQKLWDDVARVLKPTPMGNANPKDKGFALPGDASVTKFREALKHEDPAVQKMAATRLADLGAKAEPAMHDLAEALTNAKNSPEVRATCAKAIGRLGVAAERVVPSLAKALNPSEPQKVRENAAEALLEIKYPANAAALPALLEIIKKDRDVNLRIGCVMALSRVNQPENFRKSGAETVLTKLLDEEDDATAWLRYNAAYCLACVLKHESPPKTAELLLELLKHKEITTYKSDVSVAVKAAEVLAWLGDKAAKKPAVVKALRKAAKDEDEKLSAAAKGTMKKLNIKE